LGFFIFINVINLLHVKLFGEMEFWLAIIKVVAIIAMIAFGSYLLASGSGHSQSSLQNLWQLGGFFPQWYYRLSDGYGHDYVCFRWN
jgi:aromatic amino acid transport protein AroP